MSLPKNTMAARYDDENVEFVEWLAKQADNGYGVKRSQVLNRGWSFIRALYSVSEDALSFNCLQGLLRAHGLPGTGVPVTGLGLSSDAPSDGNTPQRQAKLHFFSRLNRRSVVWGTVAQATTSFRFPFAQFNTRRMA